MSRHEFRPRLGRYVSSDVPRLGMLESKGWRNEGHIEGVLRVREEQVRDAWEQRYAGLPPPVDAPPRRGDRVAAFLVRNGDRILEAVLFLALGGFIGWVMGSAS